MVYVVGIGNFNDVAASVFKNNVMHQAEALDDEVWKQFDSKAI